ncbi:MAG: hypothetical protein JXB00_00320 [Bacteroidales bacterium]|nr:hypothetical protein [Bacteroidales bacterium]
MKKSIFILAMLLMAATAFTQTSRRSANSPTPAREEREKSTTTQKREVSTQRSSSQSQSSTTRREPVTRQNNTATQERPHSSYNSGTSRREVTTRNSTGQTQTRPQNGQETVRRGSSTQHHSENRTVNNNVNHRQVEHQKRSTNHTVTRTAPRGSNSGVRYESPRVYRETRVVHHHYNRPPRDRYYRSRHYPYRSPVRFEIYWTPSMRIEYSRYYPMVNHWRYAEGYRIPTISAYDAIFYHGEVMNVYGKVYEVFYTGKTDEYILYFGAYYPYHDFSVVLPGWIARRLSRWPESYFERQHVLVTGLVTAFDDKPEIVIRNTGQIRTY